MIGLERKKIRLVPYDKRWARSFATERKRIKQIFGLAVVDIQHVGSTSVVGLISKPTIDIVVGLRFMKSRKRYARLMERAGYFLRPNRGRFNQRILFAKGNEKKRTHYIHLVKYNGAIWKHDLLFRDYLRTHPKRAQQYAYLKQKLAKSYRNDRPTYTKMKSDFIKRTLVIAGA